MFIGRLGIGHIQGLEIFVASITLIGYFLAGCTVGKVAKAAEKSAGKNRSKIPFFAKLAIAVDFVPWITPPVIYWAGVGLNGFNQPEWMRTYRLPDEWETNLGLGGYSAVRSLAALGCAFCLYKSVIVTTRALGSQFDSIGVREKPAIVSTGPYARVRHPMYSSTIVPQLLLAVATWSWVPLYALVIMMPGFIAKIFYEEALILECGEVRDAYAEYKKKVPYRLIPRIW